MRSYIEPGAVLKPVVFCLCLLAMHASAMAGSSIRINPRPEPHPNTCGFSFDFSKDGKSIILVDRGILYRMPFQTGSLDPLGPDDVYEFKLGVRSSIAQEHTTRARMFTP